MEVPMFKMLPDSVVNEFRRQREAGVVRPRIPQGAFDSAISPKLQKLQALDDSLSPKVRRALDNMRRGLSKPALDAMKDYLSMNLGETAESGQQGMQEPMQHEEQEIAPADQNDEADRICALLQQAGVPEHAIQRVRDMLEQDNNGDGTLSLHGPITTKKAFDRAGRRRTAKDQEQYGAGSPAGSSAYAGSASPKTSMDQPPSFSGRPGESMDPMMPPDSGEAQRDAALENMSRIQSLTPGDLVYKDGTPFSGRAPNGDQYIHGARLRRPAPAMDESAKGFFARFPDARRIQKL
jgi:hypothetical protein